jgi:hypothetical protein
MKLRSSVWASWHNSKEFNHIVSDESQQAQFLTFQSLVKLPKKKVSIIEIGPFNAGLAKQIMHQFDVSSYTCVDDTACLTACRETLSDYSNVSYIAIDEVAIATGTYDILITNNCLSETTTEYAKYVINSFVGKCKHVFIIDNFYMSSQFAPDINIDTYYEYLIDQLNSHYKVVYDELLDAGYNKRVIYASNVK